MTQMVTEIKTTQARPHWHLDLKWICGLLAAFFLTLTSMLFLLSQLTSEKVAVPLATEVVATLFSRDEGGVDDESDIEELKRQVSEDGMIALPLGDYEVTITEEQLDELSPREIRLHIFRQVVEPYYYQGARGVAETLSDDSERQEEIVQEAGLLSLINADTHRMITNWLWVSLGLSLVALFGLVWFSYRWGQLVSLGVVFTLVSFAPSLILLIFKVAASSTGQSSGSSTLLENETVLSLVNALTPVYWTVFGLGFLFLMVAFIGRALSHHKFHAAP